MQLLCPVCREMLLADGRTYGCKNKHCFDTAKEGYVNLLRSNRAGESIGDNRDMALSRRSFLSKGYYESLAAKLAELIPAYASGGELLDVCCGEGYYSAYLAERLPGFSVTGFDISKEMIRLAAKRKSPAGFFVANMTDIPVPDRGFDVMTHLFAPFCAPEFSRVLRDDGVLFSVVSGERHLYTLKEVLYEKPYLNDEAPPQAEGFRLANKVKVRAEITLHTKEELFSLLKMTPYYYHTPTSGLERLSKLDSLSTETEFVIFVYKKE